MTKNLVIALIGPTAVGKTALSIAIARATNAEIVSCDSRQFYKEMKIGTAVPSSHELAAVPHHFVQHISIHDPYSVGLNEQQALERIQQIHLSGRNVVLVGGSGLYERAVLEGLDVFPEVDQTIRDKLNHRLQTEGLDTLVKELKVYDPKYAAYAELSNPRRVLRALEVYVSSGKPFSDFHNRTPKPRPFKTVKIGLERSREELYQRINQRVDNMLEEGLEEEARKLFVHKNLNALQTVGYKELFRYFLGEWDLGFAVSEIKKNTRRFAKRQGTWYRKDESIHWFSPHKPQRVLDFISTIQP